MLIVYLLTHYFLPHHSNNQKPRIFHSSTLFVIAIFLIFYQFILYFIPRTGVGVLGYAANISLEEVVRLTNEKRQQVGLGALVLDAQLSQAARGKGEDMLSKDYWAHVSPDGTQPWTFFTNAGYQYRYAGENLARDFSTASSAVEAWMASPTHKDNMLSAKYHDIGLAVIEGDMNGVDTTIIVQLFGTKMADAHLASVVEAKPEETAVEKAIQTTPAPVSTPTSTAAPKVTAAVESPLPTGKPLYFEEGVIVESTSDTSRVLISPFTTTKGTSLMVIGTLLLVLVIDAVIVNRRRIARASGRSLAHISFLGMILAIVLILKAGAIL